MNLINELLNKFNVSLHSGINCYPDDIDICIDKTDVNPIKGFLSENNATLIDERYGVIKHAIYIDSNLYILDIKYDFSVYYNYLSAVKLSETGVFELKKSEVLHKVFKYMCQKRKSKSEYIIENIEEFKRFISLSHNFEYLSAEVMDKIMNGSVEEAFEAFHSRTLSHGNKNYFSAYVALCKEYLINKYPKGLGKSYAFIGPDGSGKSFYIDKMSYPRRQKNIYMGDWFFKAQKVYNKLISLGTPYNRFVYVLYFFENLVRSFKVGFNKVLGISVFIDRFPGTNRNAAKSGLLGLLNKLSYLFIIKPNEIIFLYAPPEVIFSRKQELSVEEIKDIQDGIIGLIGDRLIIVDTQDKDRALNNLLKIVYS